MKKIIKSNAKINIGLNVEGILDNGYHTLDMVMVPIDLSDKMTIDFKGEKGGLKIKCNLPEIPTDERNILYKIYKKFYSLSALNEEEIEIFLEKIIPSEAGLGGGSSNGAFFLKELNSYYGDFFSEKELITLSKEIGADIPFFILNKSGRIRGVGEEIEVFENRLETSLILIKPPFGISTPYAFKMYDLLTQEEKNKKSNILKIIEGISENNLYKVEGEIKNQLEYALLHENMDIKKFRENLKMISNKNFYMSGSGSAYFTFVDSKSSEEISSKLKKCLKGCKVYVCNFLR